LGQCAVFEAEPVVLWELSLLGDGGVSRPYPGSAGRCFAGALRLPRTTFVQLAALAPAALWAASFAPTRAWMGLLLAA
ncbi:MAG: hypothetical protein ACTH6C_01515, partial [Halomonas sp.]